MPATSFIQPPLSPGLIQKSSPRPAPTPMPSPEHKSSSACNRISIAQAIHAPIIPARFSPFWSCTVPPKVLNMAQRVTQSNASHENTSFKRPRFAFVQCCSRELFRFKNRKDRHQRLEYDWGRTGPADDCRVQEGPCGNRL